MPADRRSVGGGGISVGARCHTAPVRQNEVSDAAGPPLLASLAGRRGSAADWVRAALPRDRAVVELGDGGSRLRIDGRTASVRPERLPLPDDAVDTLLLSLVLPLLPRPDALFAELRRVLRPAGTLVAVVPSGTVRSFAELRTAGVRRALGGSWPNPAGLDHAGWLLTSADFAVLKDDRELFSLPLPDEAAARAAPAALGAAGLRPPGLVDAEVLTPLAGGALPVALRRLVTRR
jgi:SAM-dependent methyltransferase